MVYLDIVWILNFLVDFLLILGANRLSGFPPGWGRAAAAGCVGATYGAGCLVPGMAFLGNFLWRGVGFCAICVTAFGLQASAVRRGGCFFLLSMALGGIAMASNGGGDGKLVLSVGVLWLLCRVCFRSGGNRETYIPIELAYGGSRLSLVALLDTGNTLTDPITGEAVLVSGADVAERLLGLTREQLRDPVRTLGEGNLRGYRLIRYSAVGTEGGFLLARRFPGSKVGAVYRDPLVAFAPEEIGRGKMYQMLAGGAV